MRRIAQALAALVLLSSCGRVASSPQNPNPQKVHSDALQASLWVPSGWTETKSHNPFRRQRYVARFEAPVDEVAVLLGKAAFSGIDCAAAAGVALESSGGGQLSVQREFEIKASAGTIAAGEGDTQGGDRLGRVRFFCVEKIAAVIEVSAPRGVFASRQAELDAILGSLTFDGGGEEIAIQAEGTAPIFFVHVVKSAGQTLGQLSEWYTGSYDNWRKLSRVNENLPVPNVRLRVGRQIRIPSELVVRQDPFPDTRRGRVTQKATPREVKPNKPSAALPESEPPAQEEEAPEPMPDVIGPR